MGTCPTSLRSPGCHTPPVPLPRGLQPTEPSWGTGGCSAGRDPQNPHGCAGRGALGSAQIRPGAVIGTPRPRTTPPPALGATRSPTCGTEPPTWMGPQSVWHSGDSTGVTSLLGGPCGSPHVLGAGVESCECVCVCVSVCKAPHLTLALGFGIGILGLRSFQKGCEHRGTHVCVHTRPWV